MAKRLTPVVMAFTLLGYMALFVLAHAAHAASETGTVTLVHGVRGLTADIYLDGAVALQVFQPERTAGPLTLRAGSHAVDVRAVAQRHAHRARRIAAVGLRASLGNRTAGNDRLPRRSLDDSRGPSACR